MSYEHREVAVPGLDELIIAAVRANQLASIQEEDFYKDDENGSHRPRVSPALVDEAWAELERLQLAIPIAAVALQYVDMPGTFSAANLAACKVLANGGTAAEASAAYMHEYQKWMD